MTAELRRAATVLVLRDSPGGPEVFMVRRHDKSAFMGGAHVFPGGAVDPGDGDAADPQWCDGLDYASAQMADLAPPEALGFHVAAVRELFEEAGVLLAREESGRFAQLAGESARARFTQYRHDIHSGSQTLREVLQREQLRLAADALSVCAHWVTPPMDVRRFDTRFFVARLPGDQHAAHDEQETTESRWTTAAGAIATAERGAIMLPPPTWMMLRELEPFQSVDDVLAWTRGRAVERREPQLVHEDGFKVLIMPGNPSRLGPDLGPTHSETRFVWSEGRWRPQ